MKTFKDFLTEGPDDPDWMKIADPSSLSTSERFKANQLPRTEPTAQEVGDKARRIKQRATDMKQGYEQGPAINDVKVVLERLQKLARDLDGLAGELEHEGNYASDLDEMVQRVSQMAHVLNKAWNHLAVGGKPYKG